MTALNNVFLRKLLSRIVISVCKTKYVHISFDYFLINNKKRKKINSKICKNHYKI